MVYGVINGYELCKMECITCHKTEMRFYLSFIIENEKKKKFSNHKSKTQVS